MELISIIVPVYKVERYLDACVESIVSQTYQNLEIILVDDGSPDQCPAMCDAWAEKDQRIRVIHKKNGGAAAARNAGLDAAQGTYIGFVDSDDMVRPDMYALLMDAIRGSQKKMACCCSGWDPDAPYAAGSPATKELDVEQTFKAIFSGRIGTALWRRLYHRSVWENLRLPEGQTNEDYPVLLPSVVAAGGTVEVREKLYYYRQTPNSVTATYWKSGTHILLRNLEKMHDQVEKYKPDCLPQFRGFVARNVYYCGLIQEKWLEKLDNSGKQAHKVCLSMMRKLWLTAMFGGALKAKDKLLYALVVTRLLRPVYKIAGKL